MSQSYANHTKFDPMFHFFLLPLAAINFVIMAGQAVRHPGWGSGWVAVLSFGALMAVFKMRLYALKVQDRVIRLEERLRMLTILQDPLRSRIEELSEGQLIALRFASDAELPGLVEKCLTDNWKNAQIKKSIGAWRPDYFRV